MRVRLMLMAAVLFPFHSEGAQIQALEAEKRVTCVISKAHMNRIQIEGDRIAAVYGADHTYVMETDEVLGQVFLKAVNPALSLEPVYLSLVTEGDVTQDLKLIPSNIEAQTLIFKASLPHTSVSQASHQLVGHTQSGLSQGSVERERTLLHLIRELAQVSETQVSETQMPETRMSQTPAPEVSDGASGAGADLKLRLKGQMTREGLAAQVFHVENSGKVPFVLNPQMMAKALAGKPLAVAFEKERLSVGQTTRLFIVSAAGTIASGTSVSGSALHRGDGSQGEGS